AVKKRGDVGHLFPREVELGHRRRTSGLQNTRDEFSAAIVLYDLRTQQARARVAAAGVRAVAELAVECVERLPAGKHRGIGRRTSWEGGLCAAATTSPALAWLLRGGRTSGARDRDSRDEDDAEDQGRAAHRNQNSSLAANCICRGMLLPVLVMLPKPALPSAAAGLAKLGVLKTLKISARSCSRHGPVSVTFLKSDRSMRVNDGPCSVLLPVLPTVLIGCATNAVTSNHWAIVGLASSGLPTWFGRSAPPVFARAEPLVTVNSVPVWY